MINKSTMKYLANYMRELGVHLKMIFYNKNEFLA